VVVSNMGSLHSSKEGMTLLCVLDGHGGEKCADYVLRELPLRLAADNQLGFGQSAEIVKDGLCKTFETLDHDFLCEARAKQLDEGTTVLCALFRGSSLDVANVGDTRAVLGRKITGNESKRWTTLRSTHKAIRLSVDHMPNVVEEMERVKANGGIVKKVNGTWRVDGPNSDTMLGVSRALGDRELKDLGKRPLISSTPFVNSVDLVPEDQFLILASDGVWKAIDDADAVKIVASKAKKLSPNSLRDPNALRAVAQEAAEALVARAGSLGSRDNATAQVAWLMWI